MFVIKTVSVTLQYTDPSNPDRNDPPLQTAGQESYMEDPSSLFNSTKWVTTSRLGLVAAKLGWELAQGQDMHLTDRDAGCIPVSDGSAEHHLVQTWGSSSASPHSSVLTLNYWLSGLGIVGRALPARLPEHHLGDRPPPKRKIGRGQRINIDVEVIACLACGWARFNPWHPLVPWASLELPRRLLSIIRCGPEL